MSHYPPVIIIGMHRSGTSLLTRTLQEMGLFMGVNITRNQEARFTNAINDWIFAQAGAFWFTPKAVDSLLSDPASRPLIETYLRGVVNGPAALRFLGLKRYLSYRGMHRMEEAWGWKDPRNSFTLPLWLKVFPEARVLHIMRHGVDVAQSLRVRREQALTRHARRFDRWQSLYMMDPRAPGRRRFAHAPPCGNLDMAFDLWQAYSRSARTRTRELTEDRYMELAYEDLLASPMENLEAVTRFCGLSVSADHRQAVAGRFDKSRALAYRHDPELVAFAESRREALAEFGYET
ncbi:sulfotransferase [Ectothiorhodospira haloalkaliphila]|uniref:sulfotransferase family protein n=1 Tax=Ectothiorhodospira haloalkaliphila TaxID=421628 RepID=UPI001EE80320|nr:sulfotransferase [Ectothiorhodospira haloalkaliphila]MCG5523518.1 sulfotransferase [Ectothiorhodospira haloalkaliphila]